MNPRSRLVDHGRRWRGWLIPTALFALTPKCVLCLLAYAGLSGALIRGGPELCGATGNTSGHWAMGLAIMTVVLGLLGIFRRKRRHLTGL